MAERFHEAVTVSVDGERVSVPRGATVVAAIASSSLSVSTSRETADVIARRSVTGELRGPLCGMGICQECRVTIDGVAHRLACQTLCADGMQIVTAKASR